VADLYIAGALVQRLYQGTLNTLKSNRPVILADNVAEYVNNLYGSPKTAPTSYHDYPPCPPPFNDFFIEWNCPAGIRYPGTTTFRECGYMQAGAQVAVGGVDDMPVEIANAIGNVSQEALMRIQKNGRWHIVCVSYFTFLDGRVAPVDLTQVVLDDSGRYLHAFGQNLLRAGEKERPCSGVESVLMMALGLMQCKNVRRIDVTDEQGPALKWCRRQRVPDLRYHMLQIDPNLGHKPQHEERVTESDRAGKAFHICRGHFAHFVDDGVSNGLFGRYIFGTFWIPAHTRGSLKHGQVISTYNVKAPCNS
jgi:hypothetical protein